MRRARFISAFVFALVAVCSGLVADAAAQGGAVPRVEPANRVLRLESVEVTGVTGGTADLVRAYSGVAPGDAIDVDVLAGVRARLQATDYFSRVRLSTRRGSARGLVTLVIDVTRRRSVSFETGFGYDDLNGWFLTLLGLRLDNAIGPDSRFRLGWRTGLHVSGLDFDYRRRLRPNGPLDFNLTGYLYQQDHIFYGPPVGEPSSKIIRRFQQGVNRAALEMDVGYRVSDHTQIRVGLKVERIKPDSTFKQFSENDEFEFGQLPAVLRDEVAEQTLNGFLLRLLHDTRDSQTYPRSGAFARANIQANTSILGSDRTFVKGRMDAVKHIGVRSRSVLSSRVSFGMTETSAPFYDRFFVGGSHSVRGFPEWSLSPAEGDDGFWMASQEFRFPLTMSGRGQPRVTGLLFVDVGQGWRWDSGETIQDVESSFGYGVRVRIPWVGTIGLDAGIPMTPGKTDDNFQVHGSLGFSF